MRKLFICLFLLIASQNISWSEEKSFAFDSDMYYDVYFGGQGNNSYVLRRVRISDTGSLGGESYLVIKTDRAMKESASRGYVFIKGIVSIVPSDYFKVESSN